MNIDENKLKLLLEALPILNELEVLDCLWNAETQLYITEDLNEKYIIEDDEEYYYSLDDDKMNNLKPYIVEWFGEDYAYAIKDGEYFLISFAAEVEGMKYYDIAKISANSQQMARNIAFSFYAID